jgi:hypothetical protein
MGHLTPEKYRLLVATRYLNASDFLFAGLQRQQGTNSSWFFKPQRTMKIF